MAIFGRAERNPSRTKVSHIIYIIRYHQYEFLLTFYIHVYIKEIVIKT